MRHFIGFCVFVLVGGVAGIAAPASAAPADGVRARVDTALADPARLVHRSWRTEVGEALKALPEWKQTRTIGKTLSGRVIAGKVRLPAKVTVTADTTIVADVVELTAGSVEIVSDGHDVHLLPVTAIRKAATVRATAAVPITIDTSSHNSGSSGFSGTPGFDGGHGNDGPNATSDPNNCNNLNGGNGSAGEDGGDGGAGGNGGTGGDAGGISLPIPDGSQDSYVLIARGAAGGPGGPGGSGGNGGDGGNGGNGAFGYYECGGNGGRGGNGGKGGNAGVGKGGDGGSGGAGGNVNISYPPGYDRSRVTMDLAGGPGGGGGSPGFSGIPGRGGSGGQGGDGVFSRGNDGSPGNGGIQKVGENGSTGSPGSAGSVVDTPIVTIATNKAAYLVGESPIYTITGAPNTQILMTSTLNGGPTGEDHAPAGSTDGSGRATITGPAWTEDQAGNWMKQVTIAGQDARVFFEVRMSGPWMDWTSLGGGLTERMGAVPTQTGVITYARGTDNALYYNEQRNGAWTGWTGLGGGLSSRPVPASYYDVYARGLDGSVIHGFFHSTAGTQWESLGGYIIGTPAVTSYRCPAFNNPLARCTMVLARGGDNALWVNRQRGPFDTSWTGWEWLGGTLTSDPAATVRQGRTMTVDVENQTQVFVRNTGGGVSMRLFNGSFWEGWQDLGGSIQGTPSAAAAADYSLLGFAMFTFLFARGADDSLMLNRMDNGAWTGWQTLGGGLRSDPVASSPYLGAGAQMHVAVRGTDDGIHLNSWSRSGGWLGWRAVGGSTALTPELITNGVVPILFGVDKVSLRGFTRTVFAPAPLRVTFTAVHSGKCLDVSGVSTSDGAAVWQWDCHGGGNQQWILDQVGPNTYTVTAVHSGKCLDVSGVSIDNGAIIHQWSCHGGGNQQWRFSSTPTNGLAVTLTAVHSGKCLDVAYGSLDNAGTVWQWDCHSGTNQQWRITAV